jgi:hypothetical protein
MTVRRFARTGLVLLSAIGMFSGLGIPTVHAANPSVFATVSQPIGIAVTRTAVLATLMCSDEVYAFAEDGIATPFAALPETGNACRERYIAVSPGVGGFPKGYIYVTHGQDIVRISPDGLTVTVFATIASLPNGETGITFDSGGMFGGAMIITDRHGPIWTVTSAAVATQIADIGQSIEGPGIAPRNFGSFGGQILVGAHYTDQVFAVAPDGTKSIVGTWDSPEAVVFTPRRVCDFGSSGGAYFLANVDTDEILKFPASDFTGLRGALLPSEVSTTVGLLLSDGTTSTFQDALGGELEGSAFYPCR